MSTKDKAIRARQMDELIRSRVTKLRTSKVYVYFLLQQFKRSKLYRLLDLEEAPVSGCRLEICAGHRSDGADGDGAEICAERRSGGADGDEAEICAGRRSDGADEGEAEICAGRRSGEADGGEAEICAERRFCTWQNYLDSLGECGISFGYFAELERLERRFGVAFVRLCAAGVPVETRRSLLRGPERVAEKVREVMAMRMADAGKIASLRYVAEMWQSEYDHTYPTSQTPPQRVSGYHRHVRRWEQKLERVVEQIEQVPGDFRRGAVYWKVVLAWREIFERHLECGVRLARQSLSPELSLGHCDFLRAVRAAWSAERYGPRLPGREEAA